MKAIIFSEIDPFNLNKYDKIYEFHKWNFNEDNAKGRSFDLVNLSTDVRDTSKDQLVSGRSKIQDVLNAEVTLAENIIQQINAEAELKISSYRIRALTHGLTNEIGWKAY